MSSWIDSTNSGSSVTGLVSSKRRWQRAAEVLGQAEVQADRLGVADVQIAVGLRREAGDHADVAAVVEIFVDQVADEVGRF